MKTLDIYKHKNRHAQKTINFLTEFLIPVLADVKQGGRRNSWLPCAYAFVAHVLTCSSGVCASVSAYVLEWKWGFYEHEHHHSCVAY